MQEDLIQYIRSLIRDISEKRYFYLDVGKKVNHLLTFANTFLGLRRKGTLLPQSSTINENTRIDTIQYLKYLLSALEALKSMVDPGPGDYAAVCLKYNAVINRELPLRKIKKYQDFFNVDGMLNRFLRDILHKCADEVSETASSDSHHNLGLFYGRSRPAIEILCLDDIDTNVYKLKLEELLSIEGFDVSLISYFKIVVSPDEMTYDFTKICLD